MNSHVVVLSHRRSGTHFMLDSIANNFKTYGSPLLTLDQLIFFPGVEMVPIESFLAGLETGPRLIKSHSHADVRGYFQRDKTVCDLAVCLLKSAKIIYMFRDGRDVLTSLYHWRRSWEPKINRMMFRDFVRMPNDFGHNPYQLEMNLIEYWRSHIEGWLGAPNLLPISYEELRFEYKQTLTKVGEFIGHDLPRNLKEMRRTRPLAATNPTVAPQRKSVDFMFKRLAAFWGGRRYTTVSFRRGEVGDYRSQFSRKFLPSGGHLRP